MEKVEISIPTAEQFVENIKETDAKDIKTEFIGRIVLIIIAGLGLISVLAWDEAIKDLYKHIVEDAESLSGKFGYAILITLIGVIISIILGRIFIKRKTKI
jgi:hypothetical protein